MAVSPYITEEDVRRFILDRSIEDNTLEMDLRFSPDEIADAMDRAAREYNSVPPLLSCIKGNRLPKDTNVFLDAIAQQLYLSKVANLMANDIDYTAGGVATNLVAKQIAHLQTLIKLHSDRFRQAASDIKIATNLKGAFVHFGSSQR